MHNIEFDKKLDHEAFEHAGKMVGYHTIEMEEVKSSGGKPAEYLRHASAARRIQEEFSITEDINE